MEIPEIEMKLQKMFYVSDIIVFEPVAGISLMYDENTCDLHLKSYQTVLGVRI